MKFTIAIACAIAVATADNTCDYDETANPIAGRCWRNEDCRGRRACIISGRRRMNNADGWDSSNAEEEAGWCGGDSEC